MPHVLVFVNMNNYYKYIDYNYAEITKCFQTFLHYIYICALYWVVERREA